MLCYSNNAIKRRVQREMICLQTCQSKVKVFFGVIVRLTWLSNLSFLTARKRKFWIGKRITLVHSQTNVARASNIFYTVQCSTYRQQTAVAKLHNYFKIELFEKTENKNWFQQRKVAEGNDAPRDQLGTVRLVSSISRPVLLIGGWLVGWVFRLVLLAPVVASCST